MLARKDIDWSRINEALGLKPSARQRGAAVETIVAEDLVEEFRRWLGAPRYREALTLLHDTAPTLFPHPRKVNPAEWLYRRLQGSRAKSS